MVRSLSTLRSAAIQVGLAAADLAREAALRDYRLFVRSGTAAPQVASQLAPHAAWRAALHARGRVPAYRAFLARSGWRDDPELTSEQRVARLPVTDKESYIKAYSTEDRCVDGRIPMNGTQIDESSGSTGIPFNWVRSPSELASKQREMSQFIRFTCGQDLITINAFSMGAWATGINIGEALRRNGIVKSTGPDIDKILYTLSFFGNHYTYVITGYPPFLKVLLDEAIARGFPWETYTIHGVAAGEGMSEGLREYLEQRFATVYSGYGASDLDIGVAGEVPFTVWLRKRALEDDSLKRRLFGDDPRLPMVFQFNPLDYYIETNELNELIITINRLNMLSPRIRYNIHDAGGVLSFATVRQVLATFGLDPAVCVRPGHPVFQFPILYLFGRSDTTLSYMGANIYPQDVEEALFAVVEDARRIGAFCLEMVVVSAAGDERPCIHVEIVEGASHDPDLEDRLRSRVLQHLIQANRDFRTAVTEDPHAAELQVRLHPAGLGPFAENSRRIKRRYVVPSSAAAAHVG